MDLADLKAAIIQNSCAPQPAAGGARVGRVRCDSRQVAADDVFVAVRGVHVDGHDFIDDAVRRGASVVVAQRPVTASNSVAVVQVADSAAVLGELAQAQCGNPAGKMLTLGVTGTNGKTTVAYLTRAMLKAGGISCGMIGTVEYDLGAAAVRKADNTTPDALRLAEMIEQMRHNGTGAVVMECSSHGLDQRRTAGIDFDGAAFTNLSGDHLDYHGTPVEYLRAKSRLFSSLKTGQVAIVNAQDAASEELAAVAAQAGGRVWRFAVDPTDDRAVEENGSKPLEITARIKAQGMWGCEFILEMMGRSLTVRSRLIGAHNVSNCLAAAGLAQAAGVPLVVIGQAIESFTQAPGRLEHVGGDDTAFTVLVDYAHTDDALRRTLATIRKLADGRVIVVFGCGGDRDRSKRPRMAAAAQQYADVIVVTNDNPRNEKPEAIIAEIRSGFAAGGAGKVTEMPDRRAAIELAVGMARPADVVLIAGKGHEDYQIVGAERYDFDDRKVVAEALASKVNAGAVEIGPAERLIKAGSS